MNTKPHGEREKLDELSEAMFAGMRSGESGRFAHMGASERQKEAERCIDALIQHLLAGHDGKPVLPRIGQS